MGQERTSYESWNAALYAGSIVILLFLAGDAVFRLTRPVPALYDDAFSRWFHRTGEWMAAVGYPLIVVLWELTRRRMKKNQSLR
jgi:hypothetical protein